MNSQWDGNKKNNNAISNKEPEKAENIHSQTQKKKKKGCGCGKKKYR